MLVNILKGLLIFFYKLHLTLLVQFCMKMPPGHPFQDQARQPKLLPSLGALGGPETQDKPRNHHEAGRNAGPTGGRHPAHRFISSTNPEPQATRHLPGAGSEPCLLVPVSRLPHCAPNQVMVFLVIGGFYFHSYPAAAKNKAQKHF